VKCHLLIPGLFWPGGDETLRKLDLPALHTLLARARATQSSAQSMEEWLFHAFKVEKQQDWPVAALTLEADGGTAGNHYWLRADPVYLHVDSGQLLLADSRTFEISRNESEQLARALNVHFQGADLVFHALHPERWYLQVDKPPQLRTRELGEAAGKNIDEVLPSGPDGIYWHSVSNEIQMVLHDHAVNQAREAAGNPPVNSVWLWGGGCLPVVAASPYAQVWTNECLAKGLALASGVAASSLPQSAHEWLAQSPDAGVHLLVLDGLRAAAQFRNGESWLKNISGLEARWFAPLLTALQRGDLEELAVSSGPWSFAVTRQDLWKLWRRGRAFADYAERQ